MSISVFSVAWTREGRSAENPESTTWASRKSASIPLSWRDTCSSDFSENASVSDKKQILVAMEHRLLRVLFV